MSILLEALRKSEQGQRPVETPTIHTEQHIAVDSEPLGKGPLIVLLLIALVLIAWFIWRQYEPSTAGHQPTVALPVKEDSAIKTPVSPIQPAASAADSGGSTSGAAIKTSAKQQRTPVENYQQAATDTNKPKTVKPAKVKPQATKPKPQIANAGVSKTSTAAADKSRSNKRADAKQPQPISYWELPDAMRADVPEIKFSVLVYAGEPADRFVLVNGQRLAEGDSYQQGLVVEEIRRDGVVFSYRLYKFLVER